MVFCRCRLTWILPDEGGVDYQVDPTERFGFFRMLFLLEFFAFVLVTWPVLLHFVTGVYEADLTLADLLILLLALLSLFSLVGVFLTNRAPNVSLRNLVLVVSGIIFVACAFLQVAILGVNIPFLFEDRLNFTLSLLVLIYGHCLPSTLYFLILFLATFFLLLVTWLGIYTSLELFSLFRESTYLLALGSLGLLYTYTSRLDHNRHLTIRTRMLTLVDQLGKRVLWNFRILNTIIPTPKILENLVRDLLFRLDCEDLMSKSNLSSDETDSRILATLSSLEMKQFGADRNHVLGEVPFVRSFRAAVGSCRLEIRYGPSSSSSSIVTLTSSELIQLLNSVMDSLDDVVEEVDEDRSLLHRVQIWDQSYVFVAEAPDDSSSESMIDAMNLSLLVLVKMIRVLKAMRQPYLIGGVILARAGMHYGPLLSGVVGRIPQYGVWGQPYRAALALSDTNAVDWSIQMTQKPTFRILSKHTPLHIADEDPSNSLDQHSLGPTAHISSIENEELLADRCRLYDVVHPSDPGRRLKKTVSRSSMFESESFASADHFRETEKAEMEFGETVARLLKDGAANLSDLISFEFDENDSPSSSRLGNDAVAEVVNDGDGNARDTAGGLFLLRDDDDDVLEPVRENAILTGTENQSAVDLMHDQDVIDCLVASRSLADFTSSWAIWRRLLSPLPFCCWPRSKELCRVFSHSTQFLLGSVPMNRLVMLLFFLLWCVLGCGTLHLQVWNDVEHSLRYGHFDIIGYRFGACGVPMIVCLVVIMTPLYRLHPVSFHLLSSVFLLLATYSTSMSLFFFSNRSAFDASDFQLWLLLLLHASISGLSPFVMFSHLILILLFGVLFTIVWSSSSLSSILASSSFWSFIFGVLMTIQFSFRKSINDSFHCSLHALSDRLDLCFKLEKEKTKSLFPALLPPHVFHLLRSGPDRFVSTYHESVPFFACEALNFRKFFDVTDSSELALTLDSVLRNIDEMSRTHHIHRISVFESLVLGCCLDPDSFQRPRHVALFCVQTSAIFQEASPLRFVFGCHLGPASTGVVGTTKQITKGFGVWGEAKTKTEVYMRSHERVGATLCSEAFAVAKCHYRSALWYDFSLRGGEEDEEEEQEDEGEDCAVVVSRTGLLPDERTFWLRGRSPSLRVAATCDPGDLAPPIGDFEYGKRVNSFGSCPTTEE